MHAGPWHCKHCRTEAVKAGIRDVTLDTAVIDFLARRTLPHDQTMHPRIIRAATKLFCDARGQLWAKDANGHPTRRIPPIGERESIVKEAMANLLYPSGERVYQHLRTRLFW